MTDEEWLATPFPYEATISAHLTDDAVRWLEERGYAKLRDWKLGYIIDGYKFKFLDGEVHALFVLRWM
jgi:hypothetical protein